MMVLHEHTYLSMSRPLLCGCVLRHTAQIPRFVEQARSQKDERAALTKIHTWFAKAQNEHKCDPARD